MAFHTLVMKADLSKKLLHIVSMSGGTHFGRLYPDSLAERISVYLNLSPQQLERAVVHSISKRLARPKDETYESRT